MLVHQWARKQFGKPSRCETCGTTEAKQFDWANLSGEYRKERSDWKRLCKTCHVKLDHNYGFCKRYSHELTEDNVYIAPKTGVRECLTCRKLRSKSARSLSTARGSAVNVASQELCKELFELSDWEEYQQDSAHPYTLGFLLRKLPKLVRNEKERQMDGLVMYAAGTVGWQFEYHTTYCAPLFNGTADTPEDAAAKLAIELFRHGVLTKAVV